MSEIDKDRSEVVGRSGGEDIIEKDYQNRRNGNGCDGCAGKGKKIDFHPFGKVKKQFNRKKNGPSSSSSAAALSSRCLANKPSCGFGRYYLCLKRPQTLDSPGELQTSDPNSSEFTYEILRTLIEKNDFYSKECNTHLDSNHFSSSCRDDK